MKAKAGSGDWENQVKLQSLQSQLTSILNGNFSPKIISSSEISCDWRDWSPSQEATVRDTVLYRQPPTKFGVSKHLVNYWLEAATSTDPVPGEICICGHPSSAHQFGTYCIVGPRVCTCSKPEPVLWVSDVRYFYKATKGPHEAHALIAGIQDLVSQGENLVRLVRWGCSIRGCINWEQVGPVRLKRGRPTLKVVNEHEKNVLLCEDCLYRYCNDGGSVSEHQRSN